MNNNLTPNNNIMPQMNNNNNFRTPPPTHQFPYQNSTPQYNQQNRIPEELDLSSHSTRNVQEHEISRSEPLPDTSNRQIQDEEEYEEDLDIYSDIESNKPDDSYSANEVGSSAPLLAPPIPPVLPGLDYGSDSEGERSDNEELVIDTEKQEANNYDPADPSADTDSEPDTSSMQAVASTSRNLSSLRIIGPMLPEDIPNTDEATVSTAITQPRIVHLQPRLPENESDDDEDEGSCPNMSIYSNTPMISSMDMDIPLPSSEKAEESDSEDCPNFSIYSAASMSVAKISEEEPIPEAESTNENLSSPKPDQSEPDQSDEVESSTKDFPLIPPPTLPALPENNEPEQEEPDSVENENEEPDSNNMEKDNAHPASSESSEEESDNENQSEEISTTTQKEEIRNDPKKLIKIDENLKKDFDRKPTSSSMRILQLYDDSDFEEWSENDPSKGDTQDSPKPGEKTESTTSTSGEVNPVMAEIEKLTEAVSEEERCYTPCMDEKKDRDDHNDDDQQRRPEGICGLDTEMVSEDEKNDFDESQEVNTGVYSCIMFFKVLFFVAIY